MIRRAWIPPRGGSWPLAAAVAGLLLSPVGGARAVVPPDIPLVWRPSTGVRAAGMAGAFVALADDSEALVHNPAALARVSRPELGGSVERRAPRQEVTYLNRPEVSPVTKTKIHALGFAYPFPVYRGSFVVGMAYDRAIPLDSEYFRAGAGGGIEVQQESIIEEGSVGAWTSGVAFDLSPTLSLGASGTALVGSSRRDRTFHYGQWQERVGDFEATSSTTNMDIDAVTGTVGALLRPFEFVRAGIVLHLPETYTLKGRITEDTQRYQVAGDTLDYRDEYRFEDKVKLPLRISLGLAAATGGALTGLTVTGQADLADWTQIDYAGPIRASDRQYAYRSVTDLRVGLEYARDLALTTDSRLPLRLRAGFASIPVPYRLVVTDVFQGLYDTARFAPNRTLLSAGFGLGLDPNTMLDVAWTRTNFERSGQSAAGVVTRERVSENSILVGLTFRI